LNDKKLVVRSTASVVYASAYSQIANDRNGSADITLVLTGTSTSNDPKQTILVAHKLWIRLTTYTNLSLLRINKYHKN